MPQLVVSIIVAVVSGFLASGVTLYVTGARDRRAARGAVRHLMIVAQQARLRWIESIGKDEAARKEFYDQVGELEAKAVAANLPVHVVMTYTYLLQEIRFVAESALVVRAEGFMIEAIWLPFRSRRKGRGGFKAFRSEVAATAVRLGIEPEPDFVPDDPPIDP